MNGLYKLLSITVLTTCPYIHYCIISFGSSGAVMRRRYNTAAHFTSTTPRAILDGTQSLFIIYQIETLTSGLLCDLVFVFIG